MTDQTQPAEASLLLPVRPARALIGWMSHEEATLWLAGRRTDLQNSPQFAAIASAASRAVSARPGNINQQDALDMEVEHLAPHISALSAHPTGQQFLNEGWHVAIADLSRICAVQPSVFTDQARERVALLPSTDPLSLAQFTLPLPSASAIPFQFDASKNAYVLSSRNPNLRIAGQFQGPAQPGFTALGFVVGEMPSFMQVALYSGRYLLRDGYHRAYGLLASGITRAPVFFREFSTSGDLSLPAGLFSHDVFLGERPPVLSDYLNDQVSADIQIPATSKVVIVQGLEISSLT